MADQTLQATSNTTPDAGGTSAVTGASNTGHSTTQVAAAGSGASQEKSCRWSGFAALAVIPAILTLKISWAQNGSLDDGGIETSSAFDVEYSLNGGSSWLTAHAAIDIQSSSSGTESIALSTSQNTSQIQVRDRLSAFGGEDGLGDPLQALVQASVSNIGLEVTYGQNRVMLGMM